MLILLLCGLVVLLLSDPAMGWGLATHVELAHSALGELATVGTCAAGLILAYRRDFLCGNILADVIVGKKLSRRRRLAHHWPAGQRLLKNAAHDSSRAFAYGFLAHLAADTVAHNSLIPELIQRTGSTITLGHVYWELRADQLIDPDHRITIKHILNSKHHTHEQMMTDHVYPDLKWFGLNRSVFTRVGRLTHGPSFTKAVGFCEDLSRWQLSEELIQRHRDRALQRMLEAIATDGTGSLTRIDPNGHAAFRTLKARTPTANRVQSLPRR